MTLSVAIRRPSPLSPRRRWFIMRAIAAHRCPTVRARRGARSSVELHFGEFTFDPLTRQLRRGADEIHVSPKAFALLLELIERRPVR